MAKDPKDPIEIFIETLLREANLDSLPEENKADYIERLKGEVERRIGIIAMQELDPKGKEEFRKMVEKEPKPSPGELQEFFKSRIENFDEKVKVGLEEFAREFITAAKG